MALISTIDGPNRRIYLGVDSTSVDMQPMDIYKEMRTLRRTDEALRKYDAFLSGEGYVSKGGGKFTPRYVVCLLGTRIVPYDGDHTLTIVGEIITDEETSGIACFDKTILTPGVLVDIDYQPPQVEVIEVGSSPEAIADAVWDEDMTTHNVANSAGTALKAGTYGEGSITLDTVSGVAGTGWPIGTHFKPSNNLTDTLIIMGYGNVDELTLHSDITVLASHDISGLILKTGGKMGTDVTLVAGCLADQTAFRNINLQGVVTVGDQILVEDCSVGDLSNFKGIMNIVAFSQGSEVTFNEWATIINGTAGGEPTNEVEFNIGTAAVNIVNWNGNLKVTNKTGTDRTVINCNSGNVIIDYTCVAGKIQLIGVGTIEADNSGPGCTVDTSAFLDAAIVASELSFLVDIEGGRWRIVANQMIFYKADNITEVARFNLFDSGGSPTMENVFERKRVVEIQDLTTYTEVDAGGYISKTSDRVSFTTMPINATDEYVYKDFGDGYFGDFAIDFDWNITAWTEDWNWIVTPCMLSNSIGSWFDNQLASDGVAYGIEFDLGSMYLIIHNLEAGTTNTITTGWFGGTTPGTVYGRFTRVGTLGTVQVYSDPDRLVLVASQNLTLPTTTYRYLYPICSRGVGSAFNVSGYAENFIIT